jgi:hypothetical protein
MNRLVTAPVVDSSDAQIQLWFAQRLRLLV